MADLIDPLLKVAPPEAGASVSTPSVVTDRRRPGRLAQASPALIPLLRKPTQFVDTELNSNTDPLAPARGILVGLLLSVPFWALVGLGVWFIF
jgi:hypothetical protein